MAKVIMIQGTASGVGKSVTTAALCRILTQDGHRVLPFKSQNMSSNYHLLPDGGKMARSQALAAYACGAEPTGTLNPILLMPEHEGMEVVLCGKSLGRMDHTAFSRMKAQAFEQALAAYQAVCRNADIVVVEGAGSPVELNLNQNDIVNMGLAEKIAAPVLLVSDINRGGVFASLYGTMMLFSPPQRAHVKGIIVNKFCGKAAYFSGGKEILENLCGVPVAGIVPTLDVRLEDEDNLTDHGACKTREQLSGEAYAGDTEDYRRLLGFELDRLAAHFRAHLDMELLYRIIWEGIKHV